jgi:hypothetical protein
MPTQVKANWNNNPQWHVVVVRRDHSRWIPFSSWSRELAELMVRRYRQLEDCLEVRVECDYHTSDGRLAQATGAK